MTIELTWELHFCLQTISSWPEIISKNPLNCNIKSLSMWWMHCPGSLPNWDPRLLLHGTSQHFYFLHNSGGWEVWHQGASIVGFFLGNCSWLSEYCLLAISSYDRESSGVSSSNHGASTLRTSSECNYPSNAFHPNTTTLQGEAFNGWIWGRTQVAHYST